jgi:hypothetical protein
MPTPSPVHAARLAELQALSASRDELVLPLDLALEAVTLLATGGYALLGWEGWLRDATGRVGHSEHQGFAPPDDMPPAQAADEMRRTIEAAAAEFAARPERRDAALLFCITYDGPAAQPRR